jgi:hypothetical protein
VSPPVRPARIVRAWPAAALASLAAVTAIAIAPAALAATVVLVRAPHPNAVAIEATVRLRGELVADGFDVRVVDSPPTVDLRASLEEAAAAADVEAVVAIFEATGSDSVELWVIDRVTGKTVIRRVPTEPPSARSAEVLSIRALELLRASFLEVALAASRVTPATARPAPPPEVTRLTEAALESGRPRTWGVEVGGCLVGSLEGLSPSLVPVVRVERGSSGRFLFLGRVTVAGLGTRARIESAGAAATVSQEFGLVEGALRFRAGRRVQPFASLGAGALHLSAEGQASYPYQAARGSLWSAVADAGAGARLQLQGRFELALELHAQVARPYPAIQFFGADVALAGRPTLIGSLTLIAWL